MDKYIKVVKKSNGKLGQVFQTPCKFPGHHMQRLEDGIETPCWPSAHLLASPRPSPSKLVIDARRGLAKLRY